MSELIAQLLRRDVMTALPISNDFGLTSDRITYAPLTFRRCLLHRISSKKTPPTFASSDAMDCPHAAPHKTSCFWLGGGKLAVCRCISSNFRNTFQARAQAMMQTEGTPCPALARLHLSNTLETPWLTRRCHRLGCCRGFEWSCEAS